MEPSTAILLAVALRAAIDTFGANTFLFDKMNKDAIGACLYSIATAGTGLMLVMAHDIPRVDDAIWISVLVTAGFMAVTVTIVFMLGQIVGLVSQLLRILGITALEALGFKPCR